MTRIAFRVLKDGTIMGFEATGHTGYAEAGEDIVCAAVSALTQATLYGLLEVAKAPVMFDQQDGGAALTVMFRPDAGEDAVDRGQILLKTLQGSLQAIARDYPQHVRIIMERR